MNLYLANQFTFKKKPSFGESEFKFKMATNKNATIRYQVLNRCFRNPGRNYYIEDLVEECNAALLDIDPRSTGIKKRQVFDDIKFMRDSCGFNAPIESYRDGKKTYYRYEDTNFSINSQPLNEHEAQQLKEALMTLSRFKGMPQFKWVEEIKVRLEQSFNLKTCENIISFEENEYLTGKEFIEDLYNAIINNQALLIHYKPFKAEKDLIFEIHPYHLKQYNTRWFLFGLNEKENQISNIALDRVSSVSISKTSFKPNVEINFEEYFEDVIGVSVPYDGKAEKIFLKISSEIWPYIRTKPIHGSQKIKEKTDDFVIIEIKVIPNYELESLIFSHGEKIEVLAPEFLRLRVKERVQKMWNKYI